MDFVLLLLVSWVRRTEIHLWRFGLGAGVGAAFAFGNVLMAWSGFGFLVAKLFAIFVIVSVAYRWNGFKSLLGHTGVFLLVSFLLAGGVQGISQMVSLSGEAVAVGGLAILLVGTPLLFIIRYSIGRFQRGARINRYCIPVAIRIEGTTQALTGFMDTGNHLYEPLTGLPVILCTLATWHGVLPDEVCLAIRCGDLTQVSTMPFAKKLRVIPYRTVGTSTQWLVGMRPEWIRLEDNLHTEVIVAFQVNEIQKHGAYQVILHPALI